jgi:hypothetical protein
MMTQDQARLVFGLARDGLARYVREVRNGEYAGLRHAEKVAALVALSATFSAMFPEERADGSFNIPKSLLTV